MPDLTWKEPHKVLVGIQMLQVYRASAVLCVERFDPCLLLWNTIIKIAYQLGPLWLYLQHQLFIAKLIVSAPNMRHKTRFDTTWLLTIDVYV